MSETFGEGDVRSPEPTSSILGVFRRMQERQVIDNARDFEVPGLSDDTGGVFVRYRKPSAESLTAFEKRLESKDRDRLAVANAEALARNAVGVLWKDADGTERSIDPDYEDGYVTPFGPRLAALLDLPWMGSASALVRAVYGGRNADGEIVHVDMNVIVTAGRLMEWAQRSTEDDSGN